VISAGGFAAIVLDNALKAIAYAWLKFFGWKAPDVPFSGHDRLNLTNAPNVALRPDADEDALAHIRFHWSDPDSVNFREREADLARKREARVGQQQLGFKAKVEVKRSKLRRPWDAHLPELLREGCYKVIAVGAEAIASLAVTLQTPRPPLTGRINSPFDNIPREEPSAPSPQTYDMARGGIAGLTPGVDSKMPFFPRAILAGLLLEAKPCPSCKALALPALSARACPS
jgi:hypothetical protein